MALKSRRLSTVKPEQSLGELIPKPSHSLTPPHGLTPLLSKAFIAVGCPTGVVLRGRGPLALDGKPQKSDQSQCRGARVPGSIFEPCTPSRNSSSTPTQMVSPCPSREDLSAGGRAKTTRKRLALERVRQSKETALENVTVCTVQFLRVGIPQ